MSPSSSILVSFHSVSTRLPLTPQPLIPSSFFRLCCVFPVRPFIPQRKKRGKRRTRVRLKLASVPKSVGTPGGQIGGVVRMHVHTLWKTHTKSPPFIFSRTLSLSHTHAQTHTFPSTLQSPVTTGLWQTKYRLPSTPLTDRLPLHTHGTGSAHKHTYLHKDCTRKYNSLTICFELRAPSCYKKQVCRVFRAVRCGLQVFGVRGHSLCVTWTVMSCDGAQLTRMKQQKRWKAAHLNRHRAKKKIQMRYRQQKQGKSILIKKL